MTITVNSAITVLSEVPSYDIDGIKIKFKTMFSIAVTIVLRKTKLSLLAGINTQSEKIQAKIEKIIAHEIIRSEFTEGKYFLLAIIKTTSLLSIIKPIAAGKTNIPREAITLDKT